MTDTTERAELLALADEFDDIEVDAEGKCHWTAVANAQTHLRAQLRRLTNAQEQKPVAWQLRVKDGSYCRIIPDGELEEWKNNWANHLASGHAEIIPLGPIVSKPAPVAANASAEARLRVIDECSDALGYRREYLRTLLSAQSPASDCDKHGCTGDVSPCDPKDLQELLSKPSVLEPSDRTADVTVERAQLWRHKKRGTTYRILHNNAPMQEEQTEGRRFDGEPMVVYQDINSGGVYVRPVVEFYDGRFEALPLSNMSVTK